jgi:hypothetical protein
LCVPRRLRSAKPLLNGNRYQWTAITGASIIVEKQKEEQQQISMACLVFRIRGWNIKCFLYELRYCQDYHWKSKTYNLKLQDAISSLDEVVVVGYDVKRRWINGSVQSVVFKDEVNQPVTQCRPITIWAVLRVLTQSSGNPEQMLLYCHKRCRDFGDSRLWSL